MVQSWSWVVRLEGADMDGLAAAWLRIYPRLVRLGMSTRICRGSILCMHAYIYCVQDYGHFNYSNLLIVSRKCIQLIIIFKHRLSIS